MSNEQQRELDTIEKQVLVCLFGSESIPDATGLVFGIMGINPNSIIKEFEALMLPIMNEDGSINGSLLKKVIGIYPKYKKILQFVDLPEDNFFLSNKIYDIVNIFFPGVKNVQN